MDLTFLLKGVIIGFSIAAPVGPIGVLCIRRTLTYGQMTGLLSGLGAASADALYGCVASFGLTAISSLLIQQQRWLSLLGGLYLCYLGFNTLRSRPAQQTIQTTDAPRISVYVSTFVLTLTNPTTILSFIGVFAGLGLANNNGGDYVSATALVLGVFMGSALWWLTLSGTVNLFRANFTPRWLGWVNKISGGIIISFGLLALFLR